MKISKLYLQGGKTVSFQQSIKQRGWKLDNEQRQSTGHYSWPASELIKKHSMLRRAAQVHMPDLLLPLRELEKTCQFSTKTFQGKIRKKFSQVLERIYLPPARGRLWQLSFAQKHTHIFIYRWATAALVLKNLKNQLFTVNKYAYTEYLSF